jgi:hypothetical protein
MTAPLKRRLRSAILRARPRFGLRTLFVGLTLLCVYLGAYGLLARPQRVEVTVFTMRLRAVMVPTPTYGFRDLGSGGYWLTSTLFAPAHAVDRWLRPEAWRSTPVYHAAWP